jgi:zinc transport system substrate-binding protein
MLTQPRPRPARRCVRVLALALAALAAACGSADSTGDGDDAAISAVAGFYPVAAAVTRVGGERVAVTNLTPAGVEPHDLELRPSQVDAVEDADVVFVLGHDFQPAFEARADQRDGRTAVLLDELGDGGGRLARDPHVWLDPVRYGELVDVVADELGRADPGHRATFTRNAARFRAEIDAVDARYRSGLRECERRTLVTAHDAFGHLAERYDLTEEGVAGISPDEEPGADRLADLADLVRDQGVTTIFTEELVSPEIARALAREAGVRTDVLNPLEGLTEAELRRGDDWTSVMDRNLGRLRRALGCS